MPSLNTGGRFRHFDTVPIHGDAQVTRAVGTRIDLLSQHDRQDMVLLGSGFTCDARGDPTGGAITGASISPVALADTLDLTRPWLSQA